MPAAAQSKYVVADGIRTHYLEAGAGPDLVLLHAGEFGGCSEISWEYNIDALAQHFRVVAPDYVGFGRTEKLRDFGGHGRRMIRHITAFLAAIGIDKADFIGNSISGRFLCKVASDPAPEWPIRRLVCVSGAGFEPDNPDRKVLQDYDLTIEGMRAMLEVLFHDRKWSTDPAYVKRRHELSAIPGAWEVAASARFKSPLVPERQMFGRPDITKYESIAVPTLYVAGANDGLLEADYWTKVAARTPHGQSVVFKNCGHCPNIECAEDFNAAVLEFLLRP